VIYAPLSKQHRNHFSVSEHTTSSLLELVHCDLCGHYRTISSCGVLYYLTILDDYSHAIWVYLLCNKIEAMSMFINFVAFIERQFDMKKIYEVAAILNLIVCVIFL